MNISFEEIYSRLKHLECCYIRVGYGGKLRLGFGNKIFYEQPRLKGKFYGEWDITSMYCSWRISRGNDFICGYDDEIEFCDEVLENLNFGCISDIIQLSPFDIRMIFDTNLVIDFFLQSLDGASIIILGEKEKIAFELFSDGWEQSASEKLSGKLTEIEEAVSNLSECCHERWKNLVPKNENGYKCDDCFYYNGLDGSFYFWDYGICSNKDSIHDGKLVSVCSGCCSFQRLKDCATMCAEK